jgi:hypothetical protein
MKRRLYKNLYIPVGRMTQGYLQSVNISRCNAISKVGQQAL